MFNNAIAATFSYFDIGVVAIAAISVLLGLARGFSRSLRGLTNFLIVVIGSLCLVYVITTAVIPTELGGKFVDTVEGWLGNIGPAFSGGVNTTGGEVVIFNEGEWMPLSAVLGSGLGFLAPYLNDAVVKLIPDASGDITIAGVLAPNVAAVIIAVATFIVLVIAFSLILALVRSLFKRVETDNVKSAFREKNGPNSLSRLLGAVWTLVGGAALVLFAFAVIHMLDGFGFTSSVISTIKDSVISSQIYANNPLYDLLAKLFIK